MGSTVIDIGYQLELRAAENCSAFHDHAHLSQRGHIFRWITGDGNEIGEKTGSNAAAIFEMKNLRIAARRLTQNVQRRKSVLVHEQFHFARILAMRENADIAAHDKSHAGFARGFHALALFLDAIRLGIDAFVPAAILRDGIARRNRRTKSNAFAFH